MSAHVRTTEEIAAQVEKLKALRGRIVPLTAFNDDNNAALEAEIVALEESLTEDEVEDRFSTQNETTHALIAIQWKWGENDPDEGEDLAEGWPMQDKT